MKSLLLLAALVATALAKKNYKPIVGGVSGIATTSHSWDCCKPSCAWKENINSTDMIPVSTCAKDGVTKVNAIEQSGCNNGTAYMCNNQHPFNLVGASEYAFGFASASFTGGSDVNLCCACFELTFTDQIMNEKMLVQITNTGSDLGQNHFDIAIPGGGVGNFTQGCHDQWNAPWTGWGDQYGGVTTRAECSTLPIQLLVGCYFRFDWFRNANNPGVTFQQITCPDVLVEYSGCELPRS